MASEIGPLTDPEIIATLADELPVGLWVARAPGGEFVYANHMFAEIMGTAGLADPVLGGYGSPYGIFTRDGIPYPEHQMPFVRALEERRIVVVDDITIRRPDGKRVDVRAYARPALDANGEITHVVIAFFDITREVLAQQARQETEQRLARAQRLESVGTLATGIVNDFTNLTFGIKLIASELAANETDPHKLRSLAMIDDITERATVLTRSLLGDVAGAGARRADGKGEGDAHTAPPRGTGTILVVDDDDFVRRAITLAIGNLGYDTAEAVGGADAVEIYREHRDQISGVVLDMVMPGLTGRETYLALAAIAPTVPVLLMSGFVLDAEVQAVLALGARGFVAKPCTVDNLARALAAILA